MRSVRCMTGELKGKTKTWTPLRSFCKKGCTRRSEAAYFHPAMPAPRPFPCPMSPLNPASLRGRARGVWTLAATVVGLVAGMGCQWNHVQSPSSKRPYDRRATGLHPEVVLHRIAPNDLDVYLKLRRSEVLYTRDHSEAPFVGHVTLSVNDTTWEVRDTVWHETGPELRMRWRCRGTDRVARVVLEDKLRNATWTRSDDLGDPSEPTVAHRSQLLLWSLTDGWALPGDEAAAGDTVSIVFPGDLAPDAPWTVHHVLPPAVLPPPPYSGARTRWDTVVAQPVTTLPSSDLTHVVVPEGLTVLRQPDRGLEMRIHGRRPHFPELVAPEDLIRPLRYIASRSEFNALQSADHPKLALDEFWLACGNHPDAARTLLATYYERVVEANLAFSGLTEGWMTDRGMIHIVFGIPQRVRKDAWNEYWIYGEEGTANALTFHFRRRTHPLDDNRFELQRSIQFRSLWDRAISNWRNGRVRGD